MQNLHQLFDLQYVGQIFGGDSAKFCGFLRIYKLYPLSTCVHLYAVLISVIKFIPHKIPKMKNLQPNCADITYSSHGKTKVKTRGCIMMVMASEAIHVSEV